MGLMSPKIVVLGILCGYPATEVDLLIPSLGETPSEFESRLRHQIVDSTHPLGICGHAYEVNTLRLH